MSARIGQPVTQVRLTNVAVVRLRRSGKRFEIACYKNKAVSYRQGLEEDLDEVLQIPSVFENVSKGVVAKNKDLMKAFKTTDHLECCKFILTKGDVQISEGERQVAYDSMFRDVASIIAGMCVNPSSNRPYTVSMIMRSMKEIHTAVNLNKSAKLQALKTITKLKKVMQIERARMHLELVCPSNVGKELKKRAKALGADITSETWGASLRMEVLVLPGAFRPLHDAVQELGKGQGSVEVLEAQVQTTGEAKLEDEAQRLGALSLNAAAEPSAGAEGGGEEGAGEGSGPGAGAGAGSGAGSGASSGAGSGAGSTAAPDAGGRPVAKRGGKKKKKGKVIRCGTCREEFAQPGDHRTHCKSDWHRLNLKRKLKGEEPVPEDEFRAMDSAALDDFFSEL